MATIETHFKYCRIRSIFRKDLPIDLCFTFSPKLLDDGIFEGGLTATDVFAVEWIQTGVIHFGMTVSYFGFVSDVLELSEKYQKRFGPLRYLVAEFLKFLSLSNYNYEVEYLPASKED